MRSKKKNKSGFDPRGHYVWYQDRLEYRPVPQTQLKQNGKLIRPIILSLAVCLVWLVVAIDVSAALVRHLW